MGEVIRLALPESPLSQYLATLDSELSRRTMLRCILTLQEILGRTLHLVSPGDILSIRAELGRRYEPATGSKHLSALRGYLKVANRMGLVDPKTMAALAEARNFKGSRLLRGRALAEEEIRAMLEQCVQTVPLGARDGAMVAILRAGLRRQEVVDLDLEHADLSGLGTLKVRGKGNKEREVPLPEGGRLLILKWLVYRGTDSGPLLSNTLDLPKLSRLSTTTVDDRVKAIWTAACLANGKRQPSPHDMRRTLATDLLDRGAELHAVQEILGHSNPTVTARYDRGVERRKIAAMSLISLEPSCNPDSGAKEE